MSVEMVKQTIKKTCEGCGSVTEYDLVPLTEDTVKLLEGWYTVIREIWNPMQGNFEKLAVQSCSLACVPAAAVKLALPPAPEEPEIDLASLRSPETVN